jgi:hypothetical protein
MSRNDGSNEMVYGQGRFDVAKKVGRGIMNADPTQKKILLNGEG